jgi:zinc protease
MIADAIYAQDNQRTLAQWYGAALTSGLTIEQVRQWPVQIRAVTAEAVREAARHWLDRRRSVTGYLVKELRAEEKRS